MALIVLVSGLPFLTGVTSPFVTWDDNYYVTHSDHIHADGWRGFKGLWNFGTALQDSQIEFFPLRDSVYWVLWHTFGKTPLPYHLTNLALHLLAAVLVRALALRLGFSAWVALVAALLFGTHPVHVESVTWVAALKDPLFLSLMLGSMLWFLSYRESLKPWQYRLSLLLLAGALMSKSLALPTVGLMLVAERWVGTPTPWKEIALRLFGPAALTALSLAHVLAIGKVSLVVSGPHGGNWATHWQLMGWAMVRYVQQAFVPATFRLHYCFPPPTGATDVRLWVTLATLPALLALGVYAWKRDRRLATLWVWFFACLLPVANFIPFPSLMADRYLYSPSVAVVVVMAWVLEQARLRQLLVTAVVLVFAATTASRAALWQDETALWDEVAEGTSCWEDTSLLATNAVNEWASHQKSPREALDAFRRALHHRGVQRLEAMMLCERYHRSVLGKTLDDAALELEAAQLQVEFCPELPDTWERLAVVYWTRDPQQALRAAQKLYELDPFLLRRWQLGLARLNAGDVSGGTEMTESLTADPAGLCPLYKVWFARVTDRDRALGEALAPLCP